VRRTKWVELVVIGLLAGAIATLCAILIPWLPTSASRQAGRIAFTYWFATIICLFIFAVVMAILIYAIINFRAEPGDWSDGPPVHGHTTLEIVWTVIPAVLVTSISIVSAIVLAKNGNAGNNPLVVKVTAQQFSWQFTYPNKKTYPILRLPVNRPVKLEITATDVVHSFWVPEFFQKQDAVPGQVNSLVITPDKLNNAKRPFYPVICTELCGLGHALMRSHVDVVEPAAYQAWLAKGSQAPGSPGLAVFQENGCGGCHTFKPAAATGTVGPDLDNLREEAQKANRGTEAAFVKESIVKPEAYLQPGYPDAMPHTFASQIPPDKLAQLVQYLVKGS